MTDFLDWAAVIKGRFIPALASTSSTAGVAAVAQAPLPLFLWAESMGGAIGVLVAQRAKPGTFAGVALLVPMLGIDAVRRPHPAIESVAR